MRKEKVEKKIESWVNSVNKYVIGQAVIVEVETKHNYSGLIFKNKIKGFISEIKAAIDDNNNFTYKYGITVDVPGAWHAGEPPFNYIFEKDIVPDLDVENGNIKGLKTWIDKKPKYKIGQSVVVDIETIHENTKTTFINQIRGIILSITAGGYDLYDEYIYGIVTEMPKEFNDNEKKPFVYKHERNLNL